MAVRWRSAVDGGIGSVGPLVVAVVAVDIAVAPVVRVVALVVLVAPPGTTGRSWEGGRAVVGEAVAAVMVAGGDASDRAGAAGAIGAGPGANRPRGRPLRRIPSNRVKMVK